MISYQVEIWLDISQLIAKNNLSELHKSGMLTGQKLLYMMEYIMVYFWQTLILQQQIKNMKPLACFSKKFHAIYKQDMYNV